MSKLTEYLTERFMNNKMNNKGEILGDFEDVWEETLFRLEGVSEMPEINVNLQKQLAKKIIELRRLGEQISKDIKSGGGR